MRLNEYQTAAMQTAGALDNGWAGKAGAGLGIAGEAGECADLVKKELFHGHDPQPEAMAKELGDVLWYVARLATAYGFALEDIANRNITKLQRRYPNGFSEDASRERQD